MTIDSNHDNNNRNYNNIITIIINIMIIIILIATQSHGKDNSRMPYLAIPVFNRPFFFRNFDTARSNLKIELRQRLGNKGQLVNLQVLLIWHQQRHQYKNIVRDKAHTATKSTNHEHSSFQLLLAEACFVFIYRVRLGTYTELAAAEWIFVSFKSWHAWKKSQHHSQTPKNLGIFSSKFWYPLYFFEILGFSAEKSDPNKIPLRWKSEWP